MLSPCFFVESLRSSDISFFAGVPDSLLKNVCAYLTDHLDAEHHIITANEGAAVSLVAGYHLATGKIGVVYMQNSGEGNTINPLASLTDKDVYHIPLLLLIGWRGQPGVHDEPQHVKQGKITAGLLDVMGIRHTVLSKDERTAEDQLQDAVRIMRETGDVYAFVVEKDTFEAYSLQKEIMSLWPMSREEAIQRVASVVGEKDIVVSSTGMISRELFEFRASMGQNHDHDFLTVGSMGHASQIALGIALAQPHRRVWCFDGDGAAIMHMGSMAVLAGKGPANYVHVVFNNGAHDSVGGQPTVGMDIDWPALAKAVGYPHAFTVETFGDLEHILGKVNDYQGPILIEIKVRKGNRRDLGRPTTTPIQNKEALMSFLQK